MSSQPTYTDNGVQPGVAGVSPVSPPHFPLPGGVPARLAIFGRAPTFAVPLRVGTPNVPDKERVLQRISSLLDARRLSNDGPLVRQFERSIEQISGARHCIATCNGTMALQLVARGLELSGDVILPSWTFVATAHALRWLGLRPVFVDVDPCELTIDVDAVGRHITPQTSAIFGVHTFGQTCHVSRLNELAQRYGLKLVFDACHAFGCSREGVMVGNFGDAEVFSFHATKFVSAAEGGAIVTNDSRLAARLRAMRNFGLTAPDLVDGIGINGKMNELSAALGLTSLEHLATIVEHNRAIYESYRQILARLPHLSLLEFDHRERNNYQYVVMSVASDCPLTRDELFQVLAAEGLMARKYFYPGCHRVPPYDEVLSITDRFPVTDWAADHLLALPTGLAVSPADVGAVGDLLVEALAQADNVRRLLRANDR